MGRLKFKPGDKVLFDFAGSRFSGTFVERKVVEYGVSTSREYYICEGRDGTKYPVEKSQILPDEN